MLRLLVLTALTSAFRVNCSSSTTTATTAVMVVKAMDFEVFGRVQGVFFRKSKEASISMALHAMDFEIFGTVQGVNFRMYTKSEADKLGLRGWCKNTAQGTVQGHMQGPADKVETMMQWLKTTGSPSSRIEKAEFRNQKDINEYTFDDFGIVKD